MRQGTGKFQCTLPTVFLPVDVLFAQVSFWKMPRKMPFTSPTLFSVRKTHYLNISFSMREEGAAMWMRTRDRNRSHVTAAVLACLRWEKYVDVLKSMKL